MTKVVGLFLCALIVAGAGYSQTAHAQRQNDRNDWELLGCVDVGRRAERDVIDVGRRQGRFSALRLRALGNDIAIEDLRVIYGNGRPDDIRVRSVLQEDSQTRPLDLEGRARFLDKIELTTRREFRGRGRGIAVMCVYGLESRRADRGPGRGDRQVAMQELGCARVGLTSDFDRIPVGRREGRFSAIRLTARGGDVQVESLRVIYANGRPDDISVRSRIRDGEHTRWLDLEGRGRRIDRVELVTKRDAKSVVKGIFKDLAQGRGRVGRASICVSGLEGNPFDRRR